LEVGRVVRAHGLRGEVIVTLVTDRTERVGVDAALVVGGVTRSIVASRPHQRRWIVRFEGVDSRDEAERLRGLPLLAPPVVDADALWVHELIGAEVVTVDGSPVGVVAAVEDNPAHDLLVLESGALVPVVFVVGWDATGRLRIDPPAGLLDR
jgi:16S rRNA processing protein RimM